MVAYWAFLSVVLMVVVKAAGLVGLMAASMVEY